MTTTFQNSTLKDRISIENAEFVLDEKPRVAFAIFVDGVYVHQTLEWIDEDRDLEGVDDHLSNGDSFWKSAVVEATNDDEIDTDDIVAVIHDKLEAAVNDLKQAT